VVEIKGGKKSHRASLFPKEGKPRKKEEKGDEEETTSPLKIRKKDILVRTPLQEKKHFGERIHRAGKTPGKGRKSGKSE